VTPNNGVDIEATIGTPVRSVARGRVDYTSEDYGAYGQMIILNHGDGFFTLYGHLSEIEVAVGQEVSPGQEIARSGDSGSLKGPGLHFEVRKGGSPLNPEDWHAAAHDAEHSLEPLVCWLRHARPDLEIVPIIVPAARFERLEELGGHLGAALEDELRARGWRLGQDVAIAISADGIHYGPDFKQLAFGPGGLAAYDQAVARDHGLLTGPLRGALTIAKIRSLYATFVDPDHPDDYRWTWCGRFSVPLGLLTLERLARTAGGATGHPVAYGTSVGWPELGLRDIGMAPTAPSNLYHFVGYPGAAFTVGPSRR